MTLSKMIKHIADASNSMKCAGEECDLIFFIPNIEMSRKLFKIRDELKEVEIQFRRLENKEVKQ